MFKRKKKVPRDTGTYPGPRGWLGSGRGESFYLQEPDEWRGTTFQVCGIWPFSVGTGAPMVGVPVGRHLGTGATVCCDPISWFQRAKLISNPSMFVLGKPGLGKSTIAGRMVTGLSGYGVIPLVLGDLKPDYVDRIIALDGQVISIGDGEGHINPLDMGETLEAVELLKRAGKDVDARKLLTDARSRRLTLVCALMTISSGKALSDREEGIIGRALRHLDDSHTGVPVLSDLLHVIQTPPDVVRAGAVDRGNIERYQDVTEGIEASLIALLEGGRLGEMFSKQTTNPMKRDRPVVYDVSALSDADPDVQAAALLASWSAGFSMVDVAHALAEGGLEPQRHYFIVLDELWRAIRVGHGIVDRVDALTRLNRQKGVGVAMISHTMSDLLALADEKDRRKAKGFVERSGMVLCGGLPAAEMPDLTSVVPFSRAEQDLLTGWQDPPQWDAAMGRNADPPGLGNFLIKVGGRPGIPVKLELLEIERASSDTNKRWREQSRAGARVVST